jgi:hypothetical protein
VVYPGKQTEQMQSIDEGELYAIFRWQIARAFRIQTISGVTFFGLNPRVLATLVLAEALLVELEPPVPRSQHVERHAEVGRSKSQSIYRYIYGQ